MIASTAAVASRPRVIMVLVVLTSITGVIDAVSFLGLGDVFTANMTGNVVFIGFGLAGAHGMSVARSLLALGAFAAGSVVGGRQVNTRARTPAQHVAVAMWLESALLLMAAVAVFIGTGRVSVSHNAAIACMAMAMGLRNAVVRALAVPDLTTTVLTMTLTGVAADSTLAGGSGPRQMRRLLSIAVMCAGAMVGTVVLRTAGIAAALALSALVVSGSIFFLRPE